MKFTSPKMHNGEPHPSWLYSDCHTYHLSSYVYYDGKPVAKYWVPYIAHTGKRLSGKKDFLTKSQAIEIAENHKE